MAKVFIEETTLAAIGDAIREKEGTAELVPVTDMATRISAIQSGGGADIPEEAFNLTGDLPYRFAYGGWDWFVNIYGNNIKSNGITRATYMFSQSNLEKIPFIINVEKVSQFKSVFYKMTKLIESPKVRGSLKFDTSLDLGSIVKECFRIRDFEALFTSDMLAGYETIKVTSTYTVADPVIFASCYSLRSVPSWWYQFKLNPTSTAFPNASYSLYADAFYNCYAINEVKNIPVWECTAAATTSFLGSSFGNNYMLKSITFETDNGQAKIVKWKSQTFDLSKKVGYGGSVSTLCQYNSGLSEDTKVSDDATYQALKNNPDWWSSLVGYSRYNHDSAVETINSLPDTSAYLASAGGTNTIKFTGGAGSNTDAGAINTLTAEEIAVAAAKGWTVTLV